MLNNILPVEEVSLMEVIRFNRTEERTLLFLVFLYLIKIRLYTPLTLFVTICGGFHKIATNFGAQSCPVFQHRCSYNAVPCLGNKHSLTWRRPPFLPLRPKMQCTPHWHSYISAGKLARIRPLGAVLATFQYWNKGNAASISLA